jgi:hypothetical protein
VIAAPIRSLEMSLQPPFSATFGLNNTAIPRLAIPPGTKEPGGARCLGTLARCRLGDKTLCRSAGMSDDYTGADGAELVRILHDWNNYLDRAKILLNDAISTGFRSRVVEEEMVKATIRNTRKVTDEKLKAMDEWEKRYDESRNN